MKFHNLSVASQIKETLEAVEGSRGLLAKEYLL